jgi:acyl-CoA reductase-like NAD-dependent aldehyde dehydrogenase
MHKITLMFIVAAALTGCASFYANQQAAFTAVAAASPEALQRALAEARYRVGEAAWPKSTPTDRDRILIAPPGFGPDPTALLE